MFKTAAVYTIVLATVFILGAQSYFAQGTLCILGQGTGNGNCNPGTPVVNPGIGGRTGGQISVTDSRAAEIWDAKQKKQRYLLTIRSYAESGLLCEDRAWVGGNYGGDATHMVVDVGPVKKVCYDPRKPVWTSQQINGFEREIDQFIEGISQVTKYQETCVINLNKDRNGWYAAHWQSEIKRMDAWLDYYRKGITNYRNVINQLAPYSN